MNELYNLDEFDKSLCNELIGIKNRVRNLIGDSNWGKEGEYKEIILRRMFKKIIPKKYSIGTGFVVFKNGDKIESSTQIDILVWDSQNHSQLLGDDIADFYIVKPESVRAIIEVKTTLRKVDCIEAFLKLNKIAFNINKHNYEIGRATSIGESDKYPPVFSGLFFYNGYERETKGHLKTNITNILKDQQIIEDINNRYVLHFSPAINFLTFGENIFLRYNYYKYEIHKMPKLAYASQIKSLTAWLEEDEYYKLSSSGWNENIIKSKPFFNIEYDLPFQERTQIET